MQVVRSGTEGKERLEQGILCKSYGYNTDDAMQVMERCDGQNHESDFGTGADHKVIRSFTFRISSSNRTFQLCFTPNDFTGRDVRQDLLIDPARRQKVSKLALPTSFPSTAGKSQTRLSLLAKGWGVHSWVSNLCDLPVDENVFSVWPSPADHSVMIRNEADSRADRCPYPASESRPDLSGHSIFEFCEELAAPTPAS